MHTDELQKRSFFFLSSFVLFFTGYKSNKSGLPSKKEESRKKTLDSESLKKKKIKLSEPYVLHL